MGTTAEHPRTADWKARYHAMIREFAEAVWNAYMANPCQRLYWYHTEAHDGLWGKFAYAADNPNHDGSLRWLPATTEVIPRCMTLDQLSGWITSRAGRLPIIGQ
ncbi:MAG: hypothetical protein ACLP9L_15900 [Thermoguttaceae bacterium]